MWDDASQANGQTRGKTNTFGDYRCEVKESFKLRKCYCSCLTGKDGSVFCFLQLPKEDSRVLVDFIDGEAEGAGDGLETCAGDGVDLVFNAQESLLYFREIRSGENLMDNRVVPAGYVFDIVHDVELRSARGRLQSRSMMDD